MTHWKCWAFAGCHGTARQSSAGLDARRERSENVSRTGGTYKKSRLMDLRIFQMTDWDVGHCCYDVRLSPTHLRRWNEAKRSMLSIYESGHQRS